MSEVFDPLLLAVNLHPTPRIWDFSMVGAFVLGAAAAYLFGRVLGLRVVPAVVISAAFSLSGWFFLYSNNPFSRSYVFLPLLFLFVELVLRSRRLLPVLGLSVAVAGNLYVGMPEASSFVIGGASVYAAVRARAGATAMPLRAPSSVSVAGPPGRDARLAAPAPVPAVRVPLVQRAQAGVRQWLGGGSRSGVSSTGSFRFSRLTRAESASSGTGSGSQSRSRRSSRSRVARRRSDSTLGCSSRSAPCSSSRSTTSACSMDRPPAGCGARHLPDVGGASRLVRLRDARRDRRSGAVESRSPIAALPDASRGRVAVLLVLVSSQATAGA